MAEKPRLSVRLDEDVQALLPTARGERSRITNAALRHYFEARARRISIPVATNEELQALRALVGEMNRVGVNLNQLMPLLYLAADGDGRPPTAYEVAATHAELRKVISQARAVIAFWKPRK